MRAALAVLSNLCQEPDLASSPVVIALVPAVMAIIESRYGARTQGHKDMMGKS